MCSSLIKQKHNPSKFVLPLAPFILFQFLCDSKLHHYGPICHCCCIFLCTFASCCQYLFLIIFFSFLFGVQFCFNTCVFAAQPFLNPIQAQVLVQITFQLISNQHILCSLVTINMNSICSSEIDELAYRFLDSWGFQL